MILLDTYLLFLFVEVINDDTNEQVKREEGSKDDEEDEIQIHVDVALLYGLLAILQNMEKRVMWEWLIFIVVQYNRTIHNENRLFE